MGLAGLCTFHLCSLRNEQASREITERSFAYRDLRTVYHVSPIVDRSDLIDPEVSGQVRFTYEDFPHEPHMLDHFAPLARIHHRSWHIPDGS